MKEKIFNEMEGFGWKLEDFSEVYDLHQGKMDYRLMKLEKNSGVLTETEREERETLEFITDLLRAIDNIDYKENPSKGVIE